MEIGGPGFITVDFDSHGKLHLERLKFLFNLMYIAGDIRIAETHKGYHVYIDIDGYDFGKALAVRGWLGDDPMRMEVDIKRWYSGLKHWVETLFRCKKQAEYEYCEREIDLEQLWRRWVNGWWPF